MEITVRSPVRTRCIEVLGRVSGFSVFWSTGKYFWQLCNSSARIKVAQSWTWNKTKPFKPNSSPFRELSVLSAAVFSLARHCVLRCSELPETITKNGCFIWCLSDCSGFALFKLIHELCDSDDAAYLVSEREIVGCNLSRLFCYTISIWNKDLEEIGKFFVQITSDVIKEFAEDNVKYLELRTTPRNNDTTGMTKMSYLNSVIKAIEVKFFDAKLCRGGERHFLISQLVLSNPISKIHLFSRTEMKVWTSSWSCSCQ